MASTILFLMAAAFPTVSLALQGVVQAPGFIGYPVVATTGASVFGKHSKRQADAATVGQRSGTLYTINISLGTPGQSVPVQFDTGSSELWVNPVCSKSSNPSFCNAQPRFTQSSTLVDLGTQGGIQSQRSGGYGSGGYVEFEYVYDYVTIGSARIAQQIFGAAYDSSEAVVGVMGAGPDLGGWDSPYPYVIDSLAQQGYIYSRAFSMDLKGIDSTAGSVIYGGIDTYKYSGNLIKLPIVPAAQSPDGYTRLYVRLDGISVNQADGMVVNVYTTPAGGVGQTVLLDSGYTLSALPTAIFNNLVAAFPSAVYDPTADLYTVDCLDRGQGGSLDFTFNGQVINVPYYDFVWHNPDNGLCYLGAYEDNFAVLGDTFLRAAYVVFDWDNRNIHLAQSADCGSNIVAIGSGAAAVPSDAGGCPAPQTTSSSSSSTVSSTSSSTSTSTMDTTTTTDPATTTTDSTTTSTTESSTSGSTITESTTSSSDSSTSTTESSTSTTSSSTSSVGSTTTTSSTSSSSSTSDSSTSSTETSTTSSSSTSTMSSYTSSFATGTGYATGSGGSISSTSTGPWSNSTTSTSTSTTSLATGTGPGSTGSTTTGPWSNTTSLSSATTFPGMTSTVLPVLTSSASLTTSTVTTTRIYTITSCAPGITCHPGAVTTETITSLTTFCPATALPTITSAPISKSTITTTSTKTYTITSCAPGITACHPGQVTTEIVTMTTTFCPQTSGTYAITKTWTCSAPGQGCSIGEIVTKTIPLTVVPVETTGTPVAVPGYTMTAGESESTAVEGSLAGSTGVGSTGVGSTGVATSAAVTAVTVAQQTTTAAQWTTTAVAHGGNSTAAASATPPVVTAGAAKMNFGHLLGAVGAGLVAVVAI